MLNNLLLSYFQGEKKKELLQRGFYRTQVVENVASLRKELELGIGPWMEIQEAPLLTLISALLCIPALAFWTPQTSFI